MKQSVWSSLEKFFAKPTDQSICFSSGVYPHYFFYKFFNFCRDKNYFPKKNLYVNPLDHEVISFAALLNQLMLGMNELYWLGDCTTLFSEKKYEQHAQIISSYAGPHTLVYFIDEKKLKKNITTDIVTLPSLIHEGEVEHLFSLFGKDAIYKSRKKIIKNLFERTKTVSLDQVFHCIDYLELISSSSHDQLLDYLSPLYEEDHSLFTLSNFFFAKDKASFFQTWSVLEKKYPFPFWVAFWSDQIWRAYYTVFFLKKNLIDQARTMSKRLPFAFIKVHWKQLSLEELSAAYTFLFKGDYLFKIGSNFCSFDLFFSHFFANSLKQITPSLESTKGLLQSSNEL